MIIDVSSFNGEFELWDLHYNALEPYVDEFILCEWDTTFSGSPKAFYAEEIDWTKYPKARPFYHSGNIFTEEEKLLAWRSPNTIGATHFLREFLQKESIKKALTHLNDTDTVFIGDVDEIWDKSALKLFGTYKLKLKVYTYYLNNRSNEQFWGTLKTNYGHMKGLCLNHLRTGAIRTKHYKGWHFTSQAKDLRKKLTDSYTQESYATPQVLAQLEYNVENNRDFLGRDFTYSLDEKGWPDYLKKHKGRYEHLCRHNGNETIATGND